MRPKDKILNFVLSFAQVKPNHFKKSIQLVVLITVNCNSGKNPGGRGRQKIFFQRKYNGPTKT